MLNFGDVFVDGEVRKLGWGEIVVDNEDFGFLVVGYFGVNDSVGEGFDLGVVVDLREGFCCWEGFEGVMWDGRLICWFDREDDGLGILRVLVCGDCEEGFVVDRDVLDYIEVDVLDGFFFDDIIVEMVFVSDCMVMIREEGLRRVEVVDVVLFVDFNFGVVSIVGWVFLCLGFFLYVFVDFFFDIVVNFE